MALYYRFPKFFGPRTHQGLKYAELSKSWYGQIWHDKANETFYTDKLAHVTIKHTSYSSSSLLPSCLCSVKLSSQALF
jgi:hypothetical protein